jgi:O-antigen/teichoic acid export membrane protein
MRDIARFGVGRVTTTTTWRDDWLLVRRFVVPITLAVSVVGVGICLGTDVMGVYSITTAATFMMLPVIMLRKYVESIMLGTKAVVRSILGSQVIYPLLMMLGALLMMGLALVPSASAVSVIYITATIGSLALSALLGIEILRRLRQTPKTDLEDTSPGKRAVFNSSMNFALVSLGFVMGQHIDVLLTGVLATPEDVSIVRIASRIAELAALMRAIVVLQYKPQLAEAHGQGDMVKLQELVSTMALIFVATGLPLTIGLWLFAEPVMSVFGPEFVQGAWAMRVYVLGIFFTLVCGPCIVLLSMAGQEHLASRIVWAALALNIAFDLLLIPIYGPLGCAFANLISLFFIGVASVIADNRVLKIYPTIVTAVLKTFAKVSKQ